MLPPTHNAHVLRVQLSAVRMACENSLSILTGGPGTGKTFVLKVIVALWQRLGVQPVLAAPTARAAHRINEVGGAALAMAPTLAVPRFRVLLGIFFRAADVVLCGAHPSVLPHSPPACFLRLDLCGDCALNSAWVGAGGLAGGGRCCRARRCCPTRRQLP